MQAEQGDPNHSTSLPNRYANQGIYGSTAKRHGGPKACPTAAAESSRQRSTPEQYAGAASA